MKYHVLLSERNKDVYEIVKESFLYKQSVAINMPTGTGKSFIAMELIADNPDKKILYIAPTLAILKQLKYNMYEQGLLGDNSEAISIEELNKRISIYFPNLELKTYQWFYKRQTEGKLTHEDYHYLICDEYHHTGGFKWYVSFNEFKLEHSDTRYFGMSATSQRLDGEKTIFSFDDDIVYEYSLAEAILDGELPIPLYIDCGIRNYLRAISAEETIKEEFQEGEVKTNLLNEIETFKREIHSYQDIPDIFKKYISGNSKVLYFCPPSDNLNKKENTKKIYEIYDMRDKMFASIGSTQKYYISFSDYSDSEEEEEAFIMDDTDSLRVLYTVNKYNEGVHLEALNVLILGRGTSSVSLFYQQLGRALTAGKKSNVTPIIIDLVGNIHIYQEIVEEVRKEAIERVKCHAKLPKGKTLEEYMMQFQIVDYELEQESFINKLEKNIIDNRIAYYNNEVIKIVKQIIDYCETYKKWPNSVKKNHKNPTEVEILAHNLYAWIKSIGFTRNKNDFKYADVLVDGKSVRDILNDLQKEYSYINRTVRDKIEMIKEYCKTYNEWPKMHLKPKNEKEKISKHCYAWLNRNCYFKGDEFTYKDFLIDGKSAKEILDELYKEYAKTTRGSVFYHIEKVKQLKSYCETYEEWPRKIKNPKTEREVLSSNLGNWMIKRTSDEAEDWMIENSIDGNPIVEVLKELRDGYSSLIFVNRPYVVDKIEEIISYCNKYKEFPGRVGEPTNEKEILSDQIRLWLYNHGYLNENKDFQFAKVIIKDGKTAKEILDKLYKKYEHKIPGTPGYAKEKVKKIIKYCDKYEEFPVRTQKRKQTKEDKEANSLFNWLEKNNYFNVEIPFKFRDVKYKNRTLKEILDELFNKYANISKFDSLHVIQMALKIKEYCETYNKFPSRARKPKNGDRTQKEEESDQLYNWLYNHGFFGEDTFKYNDVMITSKLSVKSLLLYYYNIYMEKKNEEDAPITNIWQAKDSKNIGLSCYYYVVEYWVEKKKNNTAMMKYYLDALLMKLKQNLVNINAQELIMMLDFPKEERDKYFYQKYTEFSLQNQNDLAILYHALYEYSLNQIEFDVIRAK